MIIEKEDRHVITPKEAYELIEHYQQARKDAGPYVTEISVKYNPGEINKTVHVGDDHFGHESSNPRSLEESIQDAGEEGIVVSHANIIESTSPKFVDTNATKVPFITQQQKLIIRQVTEELDRQGRFIFVSKNMCHEGWGSRFGFQDPIVDIALPGTPILDVGGQVKFVNNTTGEVGGSVEVYHDPGDGVTKQSPEGGLRVHSREVPDGHPDKASAFGQGHLHRLYAGQDVRHNPILSKDQTYALFGVGTGKGTRENPDEYLMSRHSVPPRNQPADAGRGVLLIWQDDKDNPGRLKPYPVADLKRSRLIYSAAELLNKTEQNGMTAEFEEQINASEFGREPEVVYDAAKSRVVTSSPTDEYVGDTPIHDRVSYTIKSDLPLAFSFIGGLRQGSSTFNEEELQSVLKELDANPFAFWFATRRLIDQGLSKNAYREGIMADLANNLSIANRGLLSIMVTDELLMPKWNKEVRQDGEMISEPFKPTDFLFSELQKPLTKPQVIDFLNLQTRNIEGSPSTNYVFLQTDRLRRFTSVINPFHGLTRIHEATGAAADLYVGGHTEEIGWRTWMLPNGHQLETLIPGGFSGFIEKGRHNEMPYPEGGQGVIVFPDHKRIYSFASHSDLMDYHRAFKLHQGMKLLGLSI